MGGSSLGSDISGRALAQGFTRFEDEKPKRAQASSQIFPSIIHRNKGYGAWLKEEQLDKEGGSRGRCGEGSGERQRCACPCVCVGGTYVDVHVQLLACEQLGLSLVFLALLSPGVRWVRKRAGAGSQGHNERQEAHEAKRTEQQKTKWELLLQLSSPLSLTEKKVVPSIPCAFSEPLVQLIWTITFLILYTYTYTYIYWPWKS